MFSSDYLIYIGSCFGSLCYLTEFTSIYDTYKTIQINDKYAENKNVNQYAFKLRCCIIIANSCFLIYNIENKITTPIYSYSFFLSLDCIIFIIRGYFLYRFLKEPIIIDDKIQNPMHDPI